MNIKSGKYWFKKILALKYFGREKFLGLNKILGMQKLLGLKNYGFEKNSYPLPHKLSQKPMSS